VRRNEPRILHSAIHPAYLVNRISDLRCYKAAPRRRMCLRNHVCNVVYKLLLHYPLGWVYVCVFKLLCGSVQLKGKKMTDRELAFKIRRILQTVLDLIDQHYKFGKYKESTIQPVSERDTVSLF